MSTIDIEIHMQSGAQIAEYAYELVGSNSCDSDGVFSSADLLFSRCSRTLFLSVYPKDKNHSHKDKENEKAKARQLVF